ncbi:MAG: glycerophosphodiester phosphodiesterase [Treponema sp.]|jgi:glycerophosphoryl diester phosphodiesterase|nr:glycerophosphodiester phosphodiesterase [Treponema sp.]
MKIIPKRLPLLPERPRPLIFAHRGCSSLAPENTMAAFKKAREIGAPGIELDVHVCGTGELVVAHDDNFQRTAPEGPNGGGRPIEELRLSEIREIDVGIAFGRQSGIQESPSSGYRGEHPPLLEQVLETFCPDMYIDIELKTRKTKGDSLPVLVADMLRHFGDRALKSVMVSSFNPFSILAFKKFCPTVPTAVIWANDRGVPPLLRHGFGRIIAHCDYLKPSYRQVNGFSRFRFQTLERRPLVPWTVDDPGLARSLLAAGCPGIISNRPQDLL